MGIEVLIYAHNQFDQCPAYRIYIMGRESLASVLQITVLPCEGGERGGRVQVEGGV